MSRSHRLLGCRASEQTRLWITKRRGSTSSMPTTPLMLSSTLLEVSSGQKQRRAMRTIHCMSIVRTLQQAFETMDMKIQDLCIPQQSSEVKKRDQREAVWLSTHSKATLNFSRIPKYCCSCKRLLVKSEDHTSAVFQPAFFTSVVKQRLNLFPLSFQTRLCLDCL